VDTVSAGTPEAYRGYLATHPQGEHASEAQQRLEDLSWDHLQVAPTPTGLSQFIARFPNTERAAQAESMMEAAVFDDAQLEGTVASWDGYLLRYPGGSWVAQARSEQEALSWSAAISGNSRAAYEAYLRRFPDTPHATDAAGWLRASRILEVQPVLLMGGTWMPQARHAALVERVKQELSRTLLPALQRTFVVRPLSTMTAVELGEGHPLDHFGVEDGLGVLVVHYSDGVGRAFEPSGHATDVASDLALYVPTSRVPELTLTLNASTPARTFGETDDALHRAAVAAWGQVLIARLPALQAHKRDP